ncbi:Hsp33 family molecular chaperone HslO [Spiroplasma sp. BIUS-1]|uniref:Hsp33 family molecular chaperone HslO n=1 Tax=Spiroplasma sp. BIUS-1 TaxID=216964 RepID=UPI0013978DE3|nr:Hsp33 family molecular chaperone HslO [Spiroplasma sp. BIUS-1]QHX36267.1 heat shock protein 33 [Spiroplasma sp. BIUS-1]
MDMEIRALSEKHNVKISIVDISEGYNEIAKLQGTNPLTSVALGRTIINNALLSLSIKDGNKMTTNINGMGLGGSIIAEFQDKKFRGYIQVPNFEIEKIEEDKGSPLSQVVGKQGFLQISRDNGGTEPYTSRVEIVSGEVNLDFMYYLQQSDQVNSLISSTVEIAEDGSIKKACGIIIQMLPGFSDDDIDFIEEKVGSLDHLVKTLTGTTNYESLIKDICDDAKILGVGELKFECTCNMEKVISSVKMLGEDDIKKIIEEGEVVEVVCDFCKKQYNVKPEELAK